MLGLRSSTQEGPFLNMTHGILEPKRPLLNFVGGE